MRRLFHCAAKTNVSQQTVRRSFRAPQPAATLTDFQDPFVVDDIDCNALNTDSLKAPTPLQLLQEDVEREIRLEEQRKRSKRMQVLYDITHPKPADYTFNGLLVPPPPYAFGALTAESEKVATDMLLRPQYRLVNQSDMTSYHFELYDLYLEIAFVGRGNCGKSSLLNALLGQPGMCRSTATPNPNRKINYYQCVDTKQLVRHKLRHSNNLVKLPGGGLQFTFVDLPGWGIDGMKPTWTEQAIQCNQCYLGARRSLNTVFYCKDATTGWTPTDEKYFNMIQNSHGMCFVVLTKCDAVEHFTLCKLMHEFYCMITTKKHRHRAYPLIIPTSSAGGGSNPSVYFLRRLIVETSGVIHGTKLRQHAMREHTDRMQKAMFAERDRRVKILQSMRLSNANSQKGTRCLESGSAAPRLNALGVEDTSEESQLCYAFRRRKEGNASVGSKFFELSDVQKDFVYGTPRKGSLGSDDEVPEGWPAKFADTKEKTESQYGALRTNLGVSDLARSPTMEREVQHPSAVPADAEKRDAKPKPPSAAVERAIRTNKHRDAVLRSVRKACRGAICEKNPDDSINGSFVSGKSIEAKDFIEKEFRIKVSSERKVRSDSLASEIGGMTPSQRLAYEKFAGKVTEDTAWDAYVESQRSTAYSPVHFTKLERRLTNHPKSKKSQAQLDYEEKKLSRKAQPAGLARNYGTNTLPKTFTRVIGA